MSSRITIDISPGELIDRLTILRVKLRNCPTERLPEIIREFMYLYDIYYASYQAAKDLLEKLLEVNNHLWRIEDMLRECEKKEQFDTEFIEHARAVYVLNDRRAGLKNEINKLFDWPIDEKIYECDTPLQSQPT